MINAAVVGGTGYTGLELIRLLLAHPDVDLKSICSRNEAGRALSEVFPNFQGNSELHFEAELPLLREIDVVFFSTPNGIAMNRIPKLLENERTKVIDLAADFRLPDFLWNEWYKQPHACPELLTEAVYGLPEIYREDIAKARVIANPGCYPTAVLLGFYPLIKSGDGDISCLIADVKSGVSGAGRRAEFGLTLGEMYGNFKAYKASAHRHFPEIKWYLDQISGGDTGLSFTPHLLPIARGIFATLYCKTTLSVEQMQSLFEDAYAEEAFVTVLKTGSHPEIRTVRGVNDCHISLHKQKGSGFAKILVVIDNLIKGASGQAVQNMNILFGLNETAGLDTVASLP